MDEMCASAKSILLDARACLVDITVVSLFADRVILEWWPPVQGCSPLDQAGTGHNAMAFAESIGLYGSGRIDCRRKAATGQTEPRKGDLFAGL